jgi:hypothetical protein
MGIKHSRPNGRWTAFEETWHVCTDASCIPSPPPLLSCGRSLLFVQTGYVHADADADARKKNIYFILFILFFIFGSCCQLEKREKNFGFRFSISEIPKLRGLRGRSNEKKKVFSA